MTGTEPTAAALYETGMGLLPAWNEKGPDADARKAEGVAKIRRAAELGHEEAMASLASGLGGESGFAWAIELSRRGNPSRLVSALTSGDWPMDACLGVLSSARGGEAWALLALAEVYGLGMRRSGSKVEIAAEDGGYGWLPGVKEPQVESNRLFQAAIDAGSSYAALRLANRLSIDDPAQALAVIRPFVASIERLPERSRLAAAQLFLRLLEDTGAPVDEILVACGALADAGDGDAAADMGLRFLKGKGVDKDVRAARTWFERAAEAGSVVGLRELGKLCEKGVEGPVDLDRARALYEEAAELGADKYARGRLVKRWGLAWYGDGAAGPGEG